MAALLRPSGASRANQLSIVQRPVLASEIKSSCCSAGGAGSVDAEGSEVRLRQRALLDLVRLRAPRLDVPIWIASLDVNLLPGIEQLVADGVLKDCDVQQHVRRFAQDIFFEWSLFHLLRAAGFDWLVVARLREDRSGGPRS